METLDYIIPGYTSVERDRYEIFWDNIFEEMLLENKYSMLVDILQELHDLTLDLVPSRKDIHKEFDEYIDIEFIKQKLENKVFSHTDFNGLFSYWIDLVKDLGSKNDEEVMKDLKQEIVDLSNEYGYTYVLPYAYFELYNQVNKINEHVTKIRNRLKERLNN